MKHVKSKRLIMEPMSIEEMDELIEKETDLELIDLYKDLKEKASDNLQEYKWYSTWKICLGDDNKQIGEFHFNGLNNCTTQMGYKINEEYWGQGYTYEVLDAMMNYALSQDEVYFIEMLIKKNDEYKVKALNKFKFKMVAETDTEALYVLEKPKSKMLIIFASIGLCIGLAVGFSLNAVVFSLNYIAIGISVGLCLGALIGATIDKNDEDKRKECQEARIKQGQEEEAAKASEQENTNE